MTYNDRITRNYDILGEIMRTTTGKAKILSDANLKQFFKLLSIGNFGERNVTIMALSHYCALRAKELAALRISDIVDKDNKLRDVLRLIPAYTKGGKHRDLPITHPKLIKFLNDWITFRQQEDGTLFNHKSALFKSQKGLQFSANSMSRMINNLYANNGFSGCTSHSGRRTLITKLVNKGISINKVQVIAGHSNIQTTLEYVNTDPIELGEIMKAL